MSSCWLFFETLNIVLSWPEDGRLRPKHVAKYNLTVIIASCLNACYVLMVQNILTNTLHVILCGQQPRYFTQRICQSNCYDHTQTSKKSVCGDKKNYIMPNCDLQSSLTIVTEDKQRL